MYHTTDGQTESFTNLFQRERRLIQQYREKLLSGGNRVAASERSHDQNDVQSGDQERPCDGESASQAQITNEVRNRSANHEPQIESGRGEPFVSFVSENLVALCSSGGGIRSATFSLGVLQGLDKFGLLPLFDYHSTVSGGGYVGGWWSCWRHHHHPQLFPSLTNNITEPDAVRRLRERSQFLSPTGWAVKSELWRGAIGLVFGAFWTLLLAAAVIFGAITAWLVYRVAAWWLLGKFHLLALPLAAFGLMLLSQVVSMVNRQTKWSERLRILGISLLIGATVHWCFDWLWLHADMVYDLRSPGTITGITSILGAGSTGWLARWIFRRSSDHDPLSVTARVSRYLPQLAAMLTLAGMCFLTIAICRYLGAGRSLHSACVAFGCASGAALAATFLTSTPSTLHRFYRERISESFLRLPGDAIADEKLDHNWPKKGLRPVHIVNCCASDTRYSSMRRKDRRGASVTLSPLGFYPQPKNAPNSRNAISLAEALTASAAAVDPAMGIYSAKLGRLVAFVLFAFNLRLGTWWSPRRSWVERYLRPWNEAFSQMSLAGIGEPSDGKPPAPDLHLTDGGHFENLAAYEMIRRRCRYIVICDGGADPEITFSDFSQLQQFVREDFGVEIDINLDPLRLDSTGRSRRHLVVGHIHYPAASDRISEDGILIYIKPTLTGDEPEDLAQYRVRNRQFPHESTGDQFFDNFQWEAYRRLGQHSIEVGFAFAPDYAPKREDVNHFTAPRMFDAALREWNSANAAVTIRSRNTAQRLLSSETPPTGNQLDWLAAIVQEVDCATRDHNESRQAYRCSLHRALTMLEAMEQAYEERQLQERGDHTENWGWENWADRLSASPDVLRWWPLIASLYGISFRNKYLGTRYDLNRLLPSQTLKSGKLPIISAVNLGASSLTNDISSQLILERLKEAHGSDFDRASDFVLLAHHELKLLDGSTRKVGLGGLSFRWNLTQSDLLSLAIDGLQVAPGQWGVGVNQLLVDKLMEASGNTANAADASGLSVESPPWGNRLRRVEIRPASGRGVARPPQQHFWARQKFTYRTDGGMERLL